MKNNFRILGPSQNMSGAMDVETADGRILPVAADHPDVQAAMMSSVPEAPLPPVEPAMTPVPDDWNPQAASSGPMPATGGGLPAPRNNYQEPERMERVPMPPRQVESGVTYQPEAPAMAAAAAPVDPGDRIMANAQRAIAATAPQGGGGAVKRKTQTTEEKHRLFTPEQQAAMGEAGSRLTEAEDKTVDAQEGALESEAAGLMNQAQTFDAHAKMVEDESTRLAQRRQMHEAQLDSYEKQRVAAEMDAKNAEGAMLGRETRSRVVAAIGMLIGGIGDAMSGTPGRTAQFIQQSLESELNRQRAELQSKRAKPGEYVNAYHQLLSQMGNEASASQAFLGVATGAVDARLKATTAGIQSKEALAKRDQLSTMLEASRAQNKLAAINAVGREVTTVDTVKTGSGGARKPAIDAETLFKALNDAKSPEETSKLLKIGGFQMTQELEPGEKAKVRELVGGNAAFSTSIDIVKRLRDEWKSAPITNPVEVTNRKAALETAFLEMLDAKAKAAGGIITPSDRESAKGIAGDATAVLEITSDTKLSQLASQTDEMFTKQAGAYGLVPVQGTTAANRQVLQSVGAKPVSGR